MSNISKYILLKIALLGLLIGRAFQFIFHDTPIRALVWDEKLFKPIVEHIFGQSWKIYLQQPNMEQRINQIQFAFAIYFIIVVFLILIITQKKITKFAAISISLLFILLALLYSKEHFYNLGHFFEFSLQVITPLIFAFYKNINSKRFKTLILLSISFTFIAHGLYAIGYYPTPGIFVEMTMISFNTGTEMAIYLLNFFGIVDFIVALLIFFPTTQRYALIYCIFWGFLTSFARIYAHITIEYWPEDLFQWFYKFMIRWPHFLIPGFLFMHIYSRNPIERNR